MIIIESDKNRSATKGFGKGISVSGLAYMRYTVKHINKRRLWNGVMILKLPEVGNINGFWITFDGNWGFIMGSINLIRLK